MPTRTIRDVAGNLSVNKELNVQRELTLFRRVPLFTLINRIEPDRMKTKAISVGIGLVCASSAVDRFLNAYKLCYLSLARILPEMSDLIRGDYFYPYAKAVRFNKSRRQLAKKYHAAERFFELDLLNCLIHFRILADRTIALSRHFLSRSNVPSFTSFNQHKRFFTKHEYGALYGTHEEYAEHIRMNTSWFDVLKTVRDDFLVHNAPKHLSLIGYSESDLDLIIVFVPSGFSEHRKKFLEAYEGIAFQFSLRRLVLDVRQFLKWFDHYGCQFPITDNSHPAEY